MTKIQGFNWDLYFLLIEKAVLSGRVITDHKPWENQKMRWNSRRYKMLIYPTHWDDSCSLLTPYFSKAQSSKYWFTIINSIIMEYEGDTEMFAFSCPLNFAFIQESIPIWHPCRQTVWSFGEKASWNGSAVISHILWSDCSYRRAVAVTVLDTPL